MYFPFHNVCGHRTRANGFELVQGRFESNISKFFTTEAVSHWNVFLEKLWTSSLLEEFKTRLGEVLTNLES